MSNKRLANIPDGSNTRTTRPLAGRQFAALMDALCANFSFEEIRSLAREGLGIEPDDVAAGVSRRVFLFELLVWCERGARTQEFVAAALAWMTGADLQIRDLTIPGWRSLTGLTGLDDYLARMKEGQNEIFLLTGDNAAAMKQSPQLEAFRARGIEVLLLDEPVDEFWTMSAEAYEGKNFASVSRGDIDLSAIGAEDEKAEEKEAAPEGDLSALIAMVKLALEKEVKDVRESRRLTDSACCLVVDEGELNMRLQKMLKASGQMNQAGQQILEINARHPLIRALADKAKGGSSREIEDMAFLLLDQARILEGEPPADIAAFARRMSAAMTRAVG